MPEFKKHKLLSAPAADPLNADGLYVVKAATSTVGNRAVLYVTDVNGVPHSIFPGVGGMLASEVSLDAGNSFTATTVGGALDELRTTKVDEIAFISQNSLTDSLSQTYGLGNAGTQIGSFTIGLTGATTTAAGLLSGADKTKLDSLVPGYKGAFNILADLTTAHPAGQDGWWAIVRDPAGPAQHYSWDSNSNTWEHVDFTAITGQTNLSYNWNGTSGVVTSDTGTDATIPVTSSLTGGVVSPTQHDYWNTQGALAATNEVAISDINARGYRTAAAANVNVYVRPDGSDANNGFTNTAAGAFLTIQAAADYLASLDLKTFNATINISAGTYTGAVLPKLLTSGVGVILGNTTTPSSVIISDPSKAAIGATDAGTWYIQGVTVSSGPLQGISASGTTTLTIISTDFSTCGHAHISAASGATVNMSGGYNITGNAAFHYLVTNFGFIQAVSIPITISPNLSITYYARAETGRMNIYYQTYTETAPTVVGTKYFGTLVGIIHAAGNGPGLPGTIAGSVDASSVIS